MIGNATTTELVADVDDAVSEKELAVGHDDDDNDVEVAFCERGLATQCASVGAFKRSSSSSSSSCACIHSDLRDDRRR
jgi:hypothetical protein